MPLKIDKERTFTRTVTVFVPTDGGFEQQTVKATYRVIGVERAASFDQFTEAGARQFLQAVLVQLDDLAGADGQPVSYNDALRDQLIDVPYVRQALTLGYADAVSKARAGN
jgi:hypothetical protein